MAIGPSPSIPFLLLFLVAIAILVPWYASYEHPLEELGKHLRILGILSPLFLLLAVTVMSSFSIRKLYSVLPKLGPDSILKAGGSPWGVAAVLFLVLLMISYQSAVEDFWNPWGWHRGWHNKV